ncbi:MAG: helix-hairpin-helix domain-containing protein [Syntrophales bacterium]|jgi:DNA polymerase/3'-5' exonuclease PolX|nr:helix-hairpin-helix domain-containing protein [Syntrophales bacterium]
MERTKEEIIAILDELALLLEMKGENPFKSRAYVNAARSLEALDEDLDVVVLEGRLATIKGVGEAISKKIEELATTGELKYYHDLKATIPAGHFEMLKIPGLGPKKIHNLYEKLGIETIGELEYACQENRLLDLPGFGSKTQKKILAGIDAIGNAASTPRLLPKRWASGSFSPISGASLPPTLRDRSAGATRSSRILTSWRPRMIISPLPTPLPPSLRRHPSLPRGIPK